jgi:hypothetical protein
MANIPLAKFTIGEIPENRRELELSQLRPRSWSIFLKVCYPDVIVTAKLGHAGY